MTVLVEKKIHTLEQEVEESKDETPKIHMVRMWRGGVNVSERWGQCE